MPIAAILIDLAWPTSSGKCATYEAAATGESSIAIVTPYRPVTMHDAQLIAMTGCESKHKFWSGVWTIW